jgi:hypothetical protein
MRRILINAFLLGFFFPGLALAQCVVSNDVASASPNTSAANGEIGQSFVACGSGTLGEVRVLTSFNDMVDKSGYVVTLYSGQGLGGSVLGTLTNQTIKGIAANGTDYSVFDFSPESISLTNGSTYTFYVTPGSAPAAPGLIYETTGTFPGQLYFAANPESGFDLIFEAEVVVAANSPPNLGGTPADDTATEDVPTAIDLSAYNISDVDGDTITLTLAVNIGTIASIDGNGVTAGVTVAGSGTASMTLQGSTANLNTYLNDTSKILYTTPLNGTSPATLTVTPNDGTENGTADTVTINVAAVNDDPTASGVPTDLTVTEDTQGNVDLSLVALADVDSANITLTLAASAGTFATPADGAGVGGGVTENLVNSTTITLLGAPSDINTYLDTASNIQYTAASNANGNDVATISLSVNDGDGSGNVGVGTVNVDVTAVNDAPAVATLPAAVTVTEDTQSSIDLSAAAFSDIDSAAITVTLTASAGTFATPADGAGVGGGVTETLVNSTTITLVGAAADINTYLDTATNIQYTAAANVSGNAAATMTVVANDGDGSGDVSLGTVNINVTAVNDAPAVATLPAAVTVTEDTLSNIDLSAAAFSDIDSATITVTLTASAGTFATPADGAAAGGGVTETLANSTTITLVGVPADINAYLDTASNIQYTAAADVSGNAAATMTVVANDGDGSGDVALGTVNINVTAVNDPPAFSGLDGTPAYTEGAAPVALDTNASVSDVELDALNGGNGDYSGASLTLLRNGGSDVNDIFSVATSGSLTVAGGPNGGGTVTAAGNVIATIANTGNGQLQFSFADNGTIPTTALVTETLQAIRYSNNSNSPAATVQLNYTVSDGADTDNGSVTVSMTNVNDAPSLTATGQNPGYIEGAGAVDLFSGVSADTIEAADRFNALTLTVTNVADGSSEILTFDGSDVALTDANSVNTATNGLTVNVSVTGTTATVSFSGATLTNAQMQTLVDALSYRNTSDNPTTVGNRVVTITGISDNGGTANGGINAAAPNITSTVSLTGVNDPPVVTNVFGESSQVVAAAGTQNVALFDDAEVANIDSLDFNGGFLGILQLTGTTNGSWGVDGTRVTSDGDAALGAFETLAVDTVSIGTVDSDDGLNGSDLTVLLNANATAERIETLIRNLEYDAPSVLGSREFLLLIDDGDGIANGGDPDDSGIFTISVTPNPPVITNLDGDSVRVALSTNTAVDAGSDATVTDADSVNFNGGNITINRTTGLSGDFALGGSATAGGDSAIAGGETIAVAGTNIGLVTGDGQGTNALVIDFNSTDATPALVQSLVRSLVYQSAVSGLHTFDLTITDASTMPATSPVNSFSVDVNAAPVVAAPSVPDIAEDAPAQALPADVQISDANGDSQEVSLTATGGSIGLGVVAGLSFTDADGSDGSLAFSGALADANAALDSLTLTPTANTTGAASLTVSTVDALGDSDSAVANFTLLDQQPAIADASFGVSPTATPGTAVGSVVTTGDQTGLSYSISAGNTGTAFAIDNAGAITVADTSALSNLPFTLTVAVDDEDGDLTANDTATVTITDNALPVLQAFARQMPTQASTNADSLVFRVSFDEDVQNVDAADFVAVGTTAGITGVAVATASSVYDVTVSGGDLAGLNGSVSLNLAGGQDITDLAGNALPNTEPAIDETYTLDNTAPVLTSIARQLPVEATTNADALTFRVTFDGDVANVDAGDFAVNGTSTASVTTVAVVTADSVFDVTLAGGDLADFNGIVGLDLAAAQDIADAAGNALPTTEPATDETYTLDNTGPELSSIVRQNPTDEATNADTLTFRASFDMDVQNVDATDFVVSGSTATVTSIATVTADTVFDLTLSGGDLADLDATVGLDLSAGQDITDGAGNALPNTEPAIDETYTLDNTAPTVSIDSLTTSDTTPPLSGTVDDNSATLELTVNGQTATPTNNGDGTWSLADDVLTALPLGTYDVAITATDDVGNEGSDSSGDELVITSDGDGDGVGDDVENTAPNNGDGNNDGIPDAEQGDVTSLPTATGRGIMTLEVRGACSLLEQVRAIDVSSYPSDPSGRVYPFGLVEFSLPCETATVDVIYHDAGTGEFATSVYRKYGPTTPGDTATAAWYDFSSYASVAGNVWTLDLADNRLGDDTGDDGIILDQGGPSSPAPQPVIIPVNKPWALVLLLLSMLVLGRHAMIGAGQRV